MITAVLSSVVVMLGGADVPAAAVSAIAASYQGAAQRAFEAHCEDCHGKVPANLPAAAATTAQKKARRAHRKFSMDDGFPFASKWPLPKLMAEIRDEVEDDDMPPKKYLQQKGVTLSAEERQAILDWARDAESRLKAR